MPYIPTDPSFLFPVLVSQATLFAEREEGSGHAATIELLPREKRAVTHFKDCIRCHGVVITSPHAWMSAFYNITALFNNCVSQRQLVNYSVTMPFLSLPWVWLATLLQYL